MPVAPIRINILLPGLRRAAVPDLHAIHPPKVVVRFPGRYKVARLLNSALVGRVRFDGSGVVFAWITSQGIDYFVRLGPSHG